MTTNMATMHNRFTCKTGVLNVHFYDNKVIFLLSMYMFSTMNEANEEYLQVPLSLENPIWHNFGVYAYSLTMTDPMTP